MGSRPWEPDDGDDPPPEGPEAELFRRDQAAEERWAAHVRQQVDMLIGGLGPADLRSLPTWGVMWRWQLKRWGRR